MDSLCDGRQMGEHHERVMERVVLGVRPCERGRSTGVHGSEHMVICEEVVKAQILNRSANQPDCIGVSPKLDLRVDRTDLHNRQSGMVTARGFCSTT